ncbi:MAG: hypothetical protein ABIE55_00870 [Candidatus Aenigmatarchaeota archaeon]
MQNQELETTEMSETLERLIYLRKTCFNLFLQNYNCVQNYNDYVHYTSEIERYCNEKGIPNTYCTDLTKRLKVKK